MKSLQKEKGFTIIEVVLVLAIAGLIFLIVFLAVPALQRGQRDQARKSDVGRLVAAVQSYQSNKRNAIPWNTSHALTDTNFVSQYLTNNSEFADPSADTYTWGAGTAAPTTLGQIGVNVGTKCDPSATNGLKTGEGARSVAFTIKLEGGGIYCQNN